MTQNRNIFKRSHVLFQNKDDVSMPLLALWDATSVQEFAVNLKESLFCVSQWTYFYNIFI